MSHEVESMFSSKPLRNTKYWKENRWGSIIAGNGLMDAAMRVVSAA